MYGSVRVLRHILDFLDCFFSWFIRYVRPSLQSTSWERVWGVQHWESDGAPLSWFHGVEPCNLLLLPWPDSLLVTAPWFNRKSSSLCYMFPLFEWPQIRAKVPIFGKYRLFIHMASWIWGPWKPLVSFCCWFRSFNHPEKMGKSLGITHHDMVEDSKNMSN